MSGRGPTHAERRRALVALSGAQRQALVASMARLAPTFSMADRLVGAVGWLQRNGWILVLAAVAVVAVRKPARLLGWAGKAWTLWQIWRQWEGQIDALLAHFSRRPHRRAP